MSTAAHTTPLLPPPTVAALCRLGERLIAAGRADEAALLLGGLAGCVPATGEPWRALAAALTSLGHRPLAELLARLSEVSLAAGTAAVPPAAARAGGLPCG
jgi:Flp pilus assembly protein TadD